MNKEKLNTTQRALRILKALKGKTLLGLSNKELADRLGENPVNITRALKVLINEGFVLKENATGNFHLSVQALQIAEAHRIEWEKMSARMSEINNRIDAGAKCGNLS